MQKENSAMKYKACVLMLVVAESVYGSLGGRY